MVTLVVVLFFVQRLISLIIRSVIIPLLFALIILFLFSQVSFAASQRALEVEAFSSSHGIDQGLISEMRQIAASAISDGSAVKVTRFDYGLQLGERVCLEFEYSNSESLSTFKRRFEAVSKKSSEGLTIRSLLECGN